MPPMNPNMRVAWQIEHQAAMNNAQMAAATAFAEANANAASARGVLVSEIQSYLQVVAGAVAANPTAALALANAQSLLVQLG